MNSFCIEPSVLLLARIFHGGVVAKPRMAATIQGLRLRPPQAYSVQYVEETEEAKRRSSVDRCGCSRQHREMFGLGLYSILPNFRERRKNFRLVWGFSYSLNVTLSDLDRVAVQIRWSTLLDIILFHIRRIYLK